MWGRANPGATVTVTIAGQTKETTADAAGFWSLKLDPMAAGGPFQLTATADTQAVFTNVLVGDVWLCSGQSNMARMLHSAHNAEAEIAAADDPDIRFFRAPVYSTPEPVDSLIYRCKPWQSCTPTTAREFSAVGYFFGRALRQELGVPIGLMQASLGDTPIQLWISRDYMEQDPVARKSLDSYDTACADPELPAKLDAFRRNGEKMSKYMQSVPQSEPGSWTHLDFDAAAWLDMDTAQPSVQGAYSALLELRRIVEIPVAWRDRDVSVALYFTKLSGNATAVFLNGARAVRQPGPPDKHWVRFVVPGNQVKPGPATLAVRTFTRWYHTQWQADFGQSEITVAGEGATLSLAGAWKCREADRFDQPEEPLHAGNRRRALCGLFNGMIHPLMPFAIKGVIWYQGENNAGDGYGYRNLMPLLINCWRDKWGQGDFPFLIVQLPNFRLPATTPRNSSWAELREAQALTAQHTPHCGVAVTIDLGEADDIHPPNKQDVGARLALAARKIAYNQDIVYTGPTYKSMQVEGNRIRIAFDHVGSGLVVRDGGSLKRFAVAGADRQFVWARATIEGNAVVVWIDTIQEPVAVRYAWADNPEGCNLYNQEGLPAMPFRTDDWRL